jgi:shikimate dehydrogenase
VAPRRRRFAVIGDPVGHSRSPAMHRAAFDALGLRHGYEAVRVGADQLSGLVQALRNGEWDGLNVTVPHKVRVLDHVDALDPSAALVGAANTLVRMSDGRVVAHNTDAPALAAELRQLVGTAPHASRGLVLGSGGAARSAVAALHALGVTEVLVRARGTPWGADDPSSALVSGWQPWKASPETERTTAVVVQATSAGMTGADRGDAVAGVVAWSALPPTAAAIDAVYVPAETPFLSAARAHGIRAIGGLGWLARQGALAFELWLGVPAPLAVMLAALRA